MKRFAFLILLLFSIPIYASHIVGGEIEFLHLQGFTYRINLIYYYDRINGQLTDNPELQEPNLVLGIFRKSDDTQVMQVTLTWLYKTPVPYTQPDCSHGEISSYKMTYTNVFTFNGASFDDPEGYYIIWARCCRNYTITNIQSHDPVAGQAAGQTFYLEFPPMVVGGQPFVNSSPKDFPALNDYACPTKPYYVDFAGTDPDGDSLAYTLVTPLSTVTVEALPPITPRPYPDIQWVTGFDLDRIINGSPPLPEYPDLNITPAGFLRVTPRSQGLYVFAVKVEQYRNKKKIGETRRDFQMLVTDCRLSAPPVITGKGLNAAAFTHGEISLTFDNHVLDNDRCFLVDVTDPDADREADNYSEFIKLKIIPMNFKPTEGTDLQSLLPVPDFGYIIGGGRGPGVIEFRICLSACPYFTGGPYQLGIIALDDACALPLMDTLRVNVDIEPPDNQRVRFNPPNPVMATLDEGTQDSWNFEAHDADNDQLIFYALTDGFSLDESGMKTTVNQNDPGVLKGKLSWDAFCDIYDFTKRTNFYLRLLVDDLDKCDINPPDTLTYNLAVILPPYPKPFIDTDLTTDPDEVEVSIEKKIYDSWTFNVTARDIVSDAQVTVRMEGDHFNPSDYGMQFTTKTGVGTVTSPFQWDLLCKKINLLDQDEFNIGFVAIDSINKCRLRQIDSLVVKVKVLKPDNSPPLISITNLSNGAIYEDGNAVVSPGQELNLQFDVRDTDVAPKDSLHVKMLKHGGDGNPLGWTWQDVGGPSVLTGSFLWSPLCSIFTDGESTDIYEKNYYFDFEYGDNRCLTAVTNTITLNVKVKDVESGGFDHEPPNVFTPNGDGVNDYYAMIRRDEFGELVNILPPDNCQGVFENIRIYNRWGKEVFTSGDRDFKWYGLSEAAGVYFYHVVFTNKEFKGTVSLRD